MAEEAEIEFNALIELAGAVVHGTPEVAAQAKEEIMGVLRKLRASNQSAGTVGADAARSQYEAEAMDQFQVSEGGTINLNVGEGRATAISVDDIDEKSMDVSAIGEQEGVFMDSAAEVERRIRGREMLGVADGGFSMQDQKISAQMVDAPDLLLMDEAAAEAQWDAAGEFTAIDTAALSAPATQMPNYVTQEVLNAVVNSLNANIINTGNNLQANQMGLQEQIINLQKQIINLQK